MKFAAAILALLAVSAHAELKWENTRQSFTYEKGNPVFKTKFNFTNTGKVQVRIMDVKSGCACCTSAKADKVAYKPGEQGSVTVRMDVRGKDVPIMKPVLVTTDDKKVTTLLLEVKTKDGQTVKVPRWGN